MDKEERKIYNHQYYIRNKDKIKSYKKRQGIKPYNYLTASHRLSSRNYYWRKKKAMSEQEHLEILAKRRERYRQRESH